MRDLIRILASLALLLVAVFAPGSEAQDYPSRSEVTNWFGVFAHAATPRKIVDLLNRELIRAIPEIRAKFPDTGATWGGSTAEQVTAAIRKESAQWGSLIRNLGIKSQ